MKWDDPESDEEESAANFLGRIIAAVCTAVLMVIALTIGVAILLDAHDPVRV